MSLIEKVEQTVDKKPPPNWRKLRQGEFTLEDFRDQLKQIRRWARSKRSSTAPQDGSLQNLPKDAKVDEGQLTRVEAIINSMTTRSAATTTSSTANAQALAKGSGTTARTSNTVLKQYLQMRTMDEAYGALAARTK